MGLLHNLGRSLAPALPALGAGLGSFFGPAGAAIGLAAGGGIASNLGQNAANQSNVEMTNASNAMAQANAREQMAFQAQQSNTAHQREVADLQAAGLNPLLSVNSGASASPGASGSTTAATLKNANEGLASSAGDMARLVLDFRKQQADIGLMDAQKDNLRANTVKTGVDTQAGKRKVPEAELLNDFYDMIRPTVKKLKKTIQNNSYNPRNDTRLR